MAKLLDIAAIYGKSNNKTVQILLENVFDSDPKFQQDFKEAFDMMLTIFKRSFNNALKTDQMIKGDQIVQISRSQQDDVIVRLVQDMIEILTNF